MRSAGAWRCCFGKLECLARQQAATWTGGSGGYSEFLVKGFARQLAATRTGGRGGLEKGFARRQAPTWTGGRGGPERTREPWPLDLGEAA